MSRFNYNPQNVKKYLFEAGRFNGRDGSDLEEKLDKETSSEDNEETVSKTPFYLKYR